MSTENGRDHEKMGLFVPGHSDEIDRRIAETEACLVNSRRFLENLSRTETPACDYLDELVTTLERQIDRLRTQQGQFEQD